MPVTCSVNLGLIDDTTLADAKRVLVALNTGTVFRIVVYAISALAGPR